MEIGIVIPLKARVVAKDWVVTSENLKATVNSVLAQTSSVYHAVVIGHDSPSFFSELEYKNVNCEFLTYSDFAPPKPGLYEPANQLKYEFDRCTKILRGIMYLKKKYPSITHWFSLDADDLIRNDFVSVVKNYNEYDAIVIDRGYFYFKNTGILNEEDEFSAYCGSSSVVSDKCFKLPSSVDEKSYRMTPFGRISHVHMKQRLLDEGWSVALPNERIIMYVRDNGENISNDAYCNTRYKKLKKMIKMILRYRIVGKEARRSFGIE